MPLLKGGQFVDDPWRAVDDDEDLPNGRPVIVSLARWRRDRDLIRRRNGPLGVRLEAGDDPAEIADDVARLDLVALTFPTFRDGRAYSSARLLRERYGFAGELRAVGQVLRDQFLFMHRCGFDAFEVEPGAAEDGWRKSLAELSVWYQPATDSRTPVLSLRHARSAAAE